MNLTSLLPLILAIASGSSKFAQYAPLVQKVVELVPLIVGPHAASAPAMNLKWAQSALTKLGFDPGPIDGIMGERTAKAIAAYQAARELDVDGWLGIQTQTKLALEVPPHD